MKKIILSLATLLISLSAFSFAPAKPKPSHVTGLAASHEIFYIRICKVMAGGKVEVYNSAGELVGAQDLNDRRLIVDFFEMVPGDYTVKVIKDGIEEIFDFHKKGQVNEAEANASSASSRLKIVQGM